MRYLSLCVWLCTAAVTLCPHSAFSAGQPADSLWQRAVVLSEKNEGLIPGSIRMRMQEVDEEGRPKNDDKYYESWSSLSLGEDGKVEFETVRAIQDGKDITEEQRAREEEAKADSGGNDGTHGSESEGMDGYDPFDPDKQARVSTNLVGAGDLVDGKNTVLYEFAEQGEHGERTTGKAWLEVETGAPVRVEYSVDPLPKRVKHMVMTMDYDYMPPDSLTVRSLSIQATGGIWFIKKHFHMDMTFGDYWRPPEQEDQDNPG
jgi:hypothetical protein